VNLLNELMALGEALLALVIAMAPSIVLAVTVGGLIETVTRWRRDLFQVLLRRKWVAHPVALLMAFASPL
jgi:Na+(H+)/acetate symporter ActP